jgi:hypothetical protein
MGSHKAGNRVQTGEEKMRLWITILIIIGLVAVPAAASFDFVTWGSSFNQIFNQSSSSKLSSLTGPLNLTAIYFTGIEDYPLPIVIKAFAESGHYSRGSIPIGQNFSYTAATLKMPNGTQVSSGTYGYQIDSINGELYLYYFADNWNSWGLTGLQRLYFNFTNPTFIPPQIYYCTDLVIPYPVAFRSNGIADCLLNATYEFDFNNIMVQRWENQTWNITGVSYDNLIYNRTVVASPSPSRVILSDDSTTFFDDNSTKDLYYPYIFSKPYYLDVLDPLGGWHNYSFWTQGIPSNLTGIDVLTINTWDGSNGAMLGGTTISLINTTSGTGYTSVTAPNGTYTFYLPAGNTYNIGATKTGYEGVNTTWVATPATDDQIDFWLYPVTNDTFNGTATFIVNDVYGLPISNVKIVSSSNDTRYTNNQGYTHFIVNRTATYSYTASKSGYLSKTVDVTLGGATSKITEIRLTAGVIPTATTPVTTVITPTLPPGTGEAATQEVSSIFFNAAGAIAILTVLAILLGLVDIMGGQRRRRR